MTEADGGTGFGATGFGGTGSGGTVSGSTPPGEEVRADAVPADGLPERLGGRVIAVDPAGRVLLFGYDDRPPRGRHWATPGGGLETGESFYAGACRELLEETGWADIPVSPVEVHATRSVYYSEGLRGLVRQYDHFFVGRVPDAERPLGEVAAMHAADGIVRYRWWSLPELDAATENIYPGGLADLVRRLT